MNIYKITKGQLITLWVFGILFWFWAIDQSDSYYSNYNFISSALVFLIPFGLIFYTIGWKNANAFDVSGLNEFLKRVKNRFLNEKFINKFMRSMRTIIGIILGLITLFIISNLVAIIAGFFLAYFADLFGISDVGSSGSVFIGVAYLLLILFGFVTGAYLGSKIYKRITIKNVDQNAPSKKWYQFSGFM